MNRFALLALFILCSCFGPQRPAPVTYYGGKAGEGSAGVHNVIEGDTLWSISKRYKIVMRDIAVFNHLDAPYILSAGQRLKLPPPMEYKVRAGDSLYAVSRIFGVSTSEIAQLNSLKSPYTIHEGDVLKLPSLTAANQPSPSSPSAVRSASVQAPHKKPVQRAKISAKTPKRASSSGKFMQPVEGRVISSYGPKKGGMHNDGINIAAPKGSPVKAAENGVVVYAGNELKGSGNLVLIRHENRWMTAYAHMDKTLIKRGQIIKRGQQIGTVGSTGSVDSPQLHFEVRRGTEAINPKLHLEG